MGVVISGHLRQINVATQASCIFAFMIAAKLHSEIDEPILCPSCKAVTWLVRILPKFASLPELRTYKCPSCGKIETYPVET